MSEQEDIGLYERMMVTKLDNFVTKVNIGVFIRPRRHQRNELRGNLWQGIEAAFRFLSTDPETRVIILAGNGRDFCRGEPPVVDTDNMETLRSRRPRENESIYQNAVRAIEECPKPVIAAIEGVCNGAGIGLITACDFRFASKKCTFFVKAVYSGFEAHNNSLVRLFRICNNESWVREIVLTGRRFDQDEAFEFYLVTKLFVDFEIMMESVIEMAETIAAKSLDSIRETKHILNYARDHSIQDSLNFAANL